MKDPEKKAPPNESMGWELGKFMPKWMTDYDFGNAANGFLNLYGQSHMFLFPNKGVVVELAMAY